MKYELKIRKEAEFDIDEHFSSYEELRIGLGHDFLLCVEEALSKIQRNPLIYKVIYKSLRRIPIRRFPYRLFYAIENEIVVITAVFHAHKDPLSLESRT